MPWAKKKKKSEAGAGEKCLGSTTLLFRYLNLGQMISNIKKNNEGKLVIEFKKCQVLKNSDNDNVSSRTIFLLSKIATLYWKIFALLCSLSNYCVQLKYGGSFANYNMMLSLVPTCLHLNFAGYYCTFKKPLYFGSGIQWYWSTMRLT